MGNSCSNDKPFHIVNDGKQVNTIKPFKKHKSKNTKVNKKQVYKLGEQPTSLEEFEQNIKKKEINKIQEPINFEPLDYELNNQINDLENNKQFEEIKEIEQTPEDKKVRKAIPAQKSVLVLDPIQEFEEFKREILSNNKIDKDMKQIMIQTRKEFIQNHQKETKFNPSIASRSNLILELEKKLTSYSPDYININIDNDIGVDFNLDIQTVKTIQLQIKKWIDGKISEIPIDYESCWKIIFLIGKLNIKEDAKQEIINIFIPDNQELFEEYAIMMNQIIYKHKLKKIEQLKQLELEQFKKEQNEKEIAQRKELVKLLVEPIVKLGFYDKKILELKEELEEPINNFISLTTEKIVLSNELENKLKHFVKSVRIAENIKNQINSIL